jgi:hypothetical protein
MSKPISWMLTVAPFSCSLGVGADEMGGDGARVFDGPGESVGVVEKSRRLLGPGLVGALSVAPLIPKLGEVSLRAQLRQRQKLT